MGLAPSEAQQQTFRLPYGREKTLIGDTTMQRTTYQQRQKQRARAQMVRDLKASAPQIIWLGVFVAFTVGAVMATLSNAGAV